MKKINVTEIPRNPNTTRVVHVSKTGRFAKRASFITAIALSAALCAGCMMGAAPASSSGTAGTASGSTVSAVTTYTGTTLVTLLDASDQFSNRDLTQTADLTDATYITVVSGRDVTITEEGVYVLSGTATDVTIYIEADESAKVQLVLDGLNVTNADMPVIYALTADKLFVTTAEGSSNTLSVTGAFAEGSAVIQSKCDLTMNGEGTLSLNSTEGKGVKCSDDLKVTGGTYVVTSCSHGFEANESIRISGGTFTITSSEKDGLHAENEDDDSEGYIYIAGGTFTIKAASDGIEGDAFVVIDGGTFRITAEEGIEGTYVQLNGGDITINASDDGINASQKSSSYAVCIEINGGTIAINMGSGDTDAIDSNGNLYINGGTLTITAQSPFDYDGVGQLSDSATVTVNGSRITSLTNQMMGGQAMGGWGGQPGDMGGQQGSQMPGDMGGQQGGQMPGLRR